MVKRLYSTWPQFIEALRYHRENPVARSFTVMETRRLAKVPSWRKYIAYLGIFLGFCCLFIWMLSMRPWNPEPEELVLMASILLLGPVYIAWLISGVYQASLKATSLLSRGHGKYNTLEIDESLMVSKLTDAEILVGTLKMILPQLLIKSFVGALGCGWFYFLIPYLNDQNMEYAFVSIMMSPLTLSIIGLSGFLGTIITVLFSVIVGLTADNHIYRNGLCMALAAMQGAWPLAAIYFMADSYFLEDVLMAGHALLGLALVFILIIGAILLAMRFRSYSQVYIGALMIVFFLMGGSLVLSTGWEFRDIGNDPYYKNIIWALSLTAVVGVSATPTELAMASDDVKMKIFHPGAAFMDMILGKLYTPFMEWWRFLILIAAQVAMTRAMINLALQAIGRRRHST